MTAPPLAASRLSVDEHNRIRRCAALAETLYPGPVGEWLAKELRAVDTCGGAFGGATLVTRLLDDLEAKQRARSAATASETHR